MENVKLFIRTSLHLLFAKDVRVGAGIFTVFNIAVYSVPYLHLFNYVVLCVLIQLFMFKRVFWTRNLEILALSAASFLMLGLAFLVVFGLVTFGVLPQAQELEGSVPFTFMDSLTEILNLIFSVLSPMTVAFFCLMVNPKTFQFTNFFIQCHLIIYTLVETLRTKKISRVPFALLSILLMLAHKTPLCFTVAAPFIAAWLFLYVFDMRLDLKQEDKATNLKQAHSF